jgi:uncharacterized protein (TIGR02217 family)
MTAFHEVQFPSDISQGSRGGPERRTDIVTLRSGGEERNSIWANSRRRYNALYNVKKYSQLEIVLAFFEERRGRLYGFRWKDWLDYRSAPITQGALAATDQVIGTGDGTTTVFQLKKTYGSAYAPWQRIIRKPVAGTVVIALAGVPQPTGWSIDTTTGLVTFAAAPGLGVAVTAGFEFDVPVRFDTDYFNVDLTHFQLGDIQELPVIELLNP